MKKFTVILLIAVLAMTSVFAALDAKIAGSVEAKYVYDIDKKTFGFASPNADITTEFTLDGATAGVTGDGLRADVVTTLAWTANDEIAVVSGDSIALTDDLGTFDFTIDTFAISKGDVWTLNLLKATAVGNFAKSTLDFIKYQDEDDVTQKQAFDNAFKFSTKGITFTWNGYTFAGVANGAIDSFTQKDFYLGVQTPNFNLGNGFTLQGAGAFYYTGSKDGSSYGHGDSEVADGYWSFPKAKDRVHNLVHGEACKGTMEYCATHDVGGVVTPCYHCSTCGAKYYGTWVNATAYTWEKKAHKNQWLFTGSLKTGFASDTMKIDVATDHALTVAVATKAVTYNADALLTATFGPKADFATVTAYYAKKASTVNLTYDDANVSLDKALLSGKVAFDFNAFGAPVKASVAGLNLFNDSKILDAEAEITIAENYKIKAFGYDLLSTEAKVDEFVEAEDKYFIDNGNAQKLGLSTELTFGPVVVGANVYTRLALKQIGFGLSSKYTNDYFVADASLNAEFNTEDAAKNGLLKIAAGVTAEDTIIKNATIGLNYASKNILPTEYAKLPFYGAKSTAHALGTVTASVAVEF